MMSVTLSQTNITNMAMKKSWPFEDVQCTYSLVNMGIFHCHVSLPECKQKFTKNLWSSGGFGRCPPGVAEVLKVDVGSLFWQRWALPQRSAAAGVEKKYLRIKAG